jgi:hypothetical protein
MPENGMTLFARARLPSAIARSAVNAIHNLDPKLAVSKVLTFDDAIAESLARDRLSALVSMSSRCLFIYFNRAFRPEREATVSVRSRARLRGKRFCSPRTVTCRKARPSTFLSRATDS